MIKQNLGQNIKQYRLQANLSQEELGQKCGVNFRTISSWESNRTEPNVKNIQDLTKALGVSESVLFGRPKNSLIEDLIDYKYGDELQELKADIEVLYNSSEREHLIEYVKKLKMFLNLKDDLGIK